MKEVFELWTGLSSVYLAVLLICDPVFVLLIHVGYWHISHMGQTKGLFSSIISQSMCIIVCCVFDLWHYYWLRIKHLIASDRLSFHPFVWDMHRRWCLPRSRSGMLHTSVWSYTGVQHLSRIPLCRTPMPYTKVYDISAVHFCGTTKISYTGVRQSGVWQGFRTPVYDRT